VKGALNALAWATIPATIDEAVYWLTRLIAHFPRRDASKDAVVISDLAADMFDAGVSLVSLVDTCDSVRRSSSSKNPWFPPSGEMLTQARDKTAMYKSYQKRLETPYRPALSAPVAKETPKNPWDIKSWEELNDDERLKIWEFCAVFGSRRVATTYCSCVNIDYENLSNWYNSRKVENHEEEPENKDDPE
jgi:hypothetical protein